MEEAVLREGEWVRFCKLVDEARKNLLAVINRLFKQGEDDLADDVFDTVTGS